MSLILFILANYWGIGAVILVGFAYFITHKKVAIAYAKKRIGALMLAAEKGAEQLVLDNGQDKLDWVLDKGYDYMPAAVRLFISKPLFKEIIQELFNEAKSLVESHKQVVPTQPVAVDQGGTK